MASRTIGTYEGPLATPMAYSKLTPLIVILITIRTIGVLSERVDTEDLIGTVLFQSRLQTTASSNDN